ncbi:aminotransferase class I/II-fold pyridoxal phosphate-dependent enzyme [Bacillus sp. N9]
MELRQEISMYVKRRFRVHYDPSDQIIVTVGASQALDLAFRTLLNAGTKY